MQKLGTRFDLRFCNKLFAFFFCCLLVRRCLLCHFYLLPITWSSFSFYFFNSSSLMADVCVAYILWFFFGLLGIHRFYLGRPISGIIWLLTVGVFGIGWLIDICLIPGMVEDYNHRYHHHHVVHETVVVHTPYQHV